MIYFKVNTLDIATYLIVIVFRIFLQNEWILWGIGRACHFYEYLENFLGVGPGKK